MRQMDSMMNSMMQDPFQGFMPMPQLLPSQPSTARPNTAMVPFGAMGGFSMANPFSMPSLGQMFQGFVSMLNTLLGIGNVGKFLLHRIKLVSALALFLVAALS